MPPQAPRAYALNWRFQHNYTSPVQQAGIIPLLSMIGLEKPSEDRNELAAMPGQLARNRNESGKVAFRVDRLALPTNLEQEMPAAAGLAMIARTDPRDGLATAHLIALLDQQAFVVGIGR